MNIPVDEALQYHETGRPGKIEISITKPCFRSHDLSLAYTPGVAEPCRVIHRDPDAAFRYTARGNLVAVVTNGTRILGLGNIGPVAGKPVMEGKAVLFKRFADIDVFDLEINAQDPDEFIRTVKLLEPTFGGINLEDIQSPDCFYIEQQLKEQMGIPVFHDDQHGTAIISAAGLLNALELTGRRIDAIKVVVNGAGAAGIAIARLYQMLGVRKENMLLCDSKGVLSLERKDSLNRWKQPFVSDTSARTLADALKGADVFVGVSAANVLTREMLRSMGDHPIVFALANPDPEIRPEEAVSARDDVIIATGRSDYPNQVNNVMGFPFIFRGALDVHARAINEEMKLAAVRAIADLAKEPVPYSVMKAYGVGRIEFGPDYIIPSPFDPRLLIYEASAVAKAAMDTGVARTQLNIDQYRERLESKLGESRKVMRFMINKARKEPKRIVYPEGDHETILKACEIVTEQGIAHPILLGTRELIEQKMSDMRLDLKDITIVDPKQSENLENYSSVFYRMRRRKGMTETEAIRKMLHPNYFGCMMVHMNHADGMVSGLTEAYPETIRPALQIIGMRPSAHRIAGLHVLLVKDKMYFFADTTVNIDPSAEDLADIALLAAREARRFNVDPRIAMISFSNFGSARNESCEKARHAAEIVKKSAPTLLVDGEMQADTAVVPEILDEHYSFSALAGMGGANVLIFPNLEAANVAYKLVNRLARAETIGPILMGIQKPVHLLQPGDYDEMDVVHMTTMAVVDAQLNLPELFV
jgi:malate dehydrogenase (oxaloacetate-decarboxylating)(NADP+)